MSRISQTRAYLIKFSNSIFSKALRRMEKFYSFSIVPRFRKYPVYHLFENNFESTMLFRLVGRQRKCGRNEEK